MGLLLSAPVAETTWLPDPGYDYDQLFSITGHITSLSALGTTRLTLRWTDPIDGARVRNVDMLVTAVGVPVELVLPLCQANGTTLSYQVQHLGVVGTPAYTFNIALN